MAFPTSSLTNNQVHKEGNRAFVYDSAIGVWDQVRESDSTENKTLREQPLSGTSSAGDAGFTGIKSHHKWYLPTQYYGTAQVNFGSYDNPATQSYAIGGEMMVNGSGHWSFPMTGYWYIQFNANTQMLAGVSDTNTRWIQQAINKTTNNWGASGSVAQVYNQLGGAGGGATYEADICSGTFAVSNIATDEVQFATFAESTTYWWAGAQNYFALFIRLGDV